MVRVDLAGKELATEAGEGRSLLTSRDGSIFAIEPHLQPSRKSRHCADDKKIVDHDADTCLAIGMWLNTEEGGVRVQRKGASVLRIGIARDGWFAHTARGVVDASDNLLKLFEPQATLGLPELPAAALTARLHVPGLIKRALAGESVQPHFVAHGR